MGPHDSQLAPDSPRGAELCSLSAGERVGVRGKEASLPLKRIGPVVMLTVFQPD
jgi:hypothetical protein